MKYVVSDIHGNLENWKSILKKINLKEDDELYVLGDVIDRYPHGIDILLQIMSMKNVHMILGNHEYMMLDAIGYPYDYVDIKLPPIEQNNKMNLWYSNGGFVTYEAFSKLNINKQMEIVNFLRYLPTNIDVTIPEISGESPSDRALRRNAENIFGKSEIKRYLLCHATIEDLYGIVTRRDFESKTSFCVWDRETIKLLTGINNIKIVFGHTPTCYFQPEKNPLEIYKNGSIIGIDCGSGFPKIARDFKCQGRLACIRLNDEKVFYSE